SFQQWAKSLHKYAGSTALRNELPYWSKIVLDSMETAAYAVEGNHIKTGQHLTVGFDLDPALTEALLTRVNRVYHTEINDILLTSLAISIADVLKKERLLVELEGHGREEIAEHIDVSRTVGWFTSVYPLLVDITEPGASIDHLVKIKEQMRKIPNKGIGFGVLRYLNPTAKEMLEKLRRPD